MNQVSSGNRKTDLLKSNKNKSCFMDYWGSAVVRGGLLFKFSFSCSITYK